MHEGMQQFRKTFHNNLHKKNINLHGDVQEHRRNAASVLIELLQVSNN